MSVSCMQSSRRFTTFRLGALVAACAFALAACGGDGSGSADSASAAGIQLKGVVIDGAIRGASVFLDLNNNLAHDSDEPVSAPTDASGGFALAVPPLSQAQLATAMLVAQVPDSAFDADDDGATLAQAGRNGFTLMTPAGAYLRAGDGGAKGAPPAVVSPLTTLVAGEVAFNGLTVAEARASIASQLGLPDADPMSDYVAAGHKGLGVIARAAAIALGDAGRSVAALAQEQGGAAVHEQIADIVETIRHQMPSVVRELGLDGPGAARPTVAAVRAALKSARPGSQMRLAKLAAAGEQRFLVVLRQDASNPAARASNAEHRHAARVTSTWSRTVKGFAATVADADAEAFLEAMSNDPDVDYVEVDRPVTALQVTQAGATWGLDRADQRALPLSSTYTYAYTGAGVRAYVIDTGIRPDHTNFGGRVASGFTVFTDPYGSNDCNGHGTHVAGTIGGATWGIAKAVTLVPVRVLDCAGSGSVSGVIAGIDWVVANAVKPAVINMSLGGSASSTLDAAIARAVDAGITVVVAAGNSSANACNASPAREPKAITIGATTSSDARASYSNYGSCLDLFAPGSSVTSTWYTSTTATSTLSGTSMASPHVAGLAALVLQNTAASTPAQVATAIKATATTGVVTSPGTGSPNLLLYTLAVGDGVTPPPPPPPEPTTWVAVGNLTGSAAAVRLGWRATATITVKSSSSATVAGAVVIGGFTNGGSSVQCTTGSNGSCSVTTGTIRSRTTQTTFSVASITSSGATYDKTRNVAGSITIRKP